MLQTDLLSDQGREAINACVKVEILGRQAPIVYRWLDATNKVRACYAKPMPGHLPHAVMLADGQQKIKLSDIITTLHLWDVGLRKDAIWPKEVEEEQEDLRQAKVIAIKQAREKLHNMHQQSFNTQRRREIEALRAEAEPPPPATASIASARRLLDACYATSDASHPLFVQAEKTTVTVFDIKAMVNAWDSAGCHPRRYEVGDPRNESIAEARQSIDHELAEVEEPHEVEHGSGFIIAPGLVLTNYHVIEDVDDNPMLSIAICNGPIATPLPCTVYHRAGPQSDLALLHCQDLTDEKLDELRIQPLPLSHNADRGLQVGKGVFIFGYPLSHTGKQALFINGYTSGEKQREGKPPFTILNCALNHGNSGGPVLGWINDQLVVLGIVCQKHIKRLLTIDEMAVLDTIAERLQTTRMADALPKMFKPGFRDIRNAVADKMHLLTLKLFDAVSGGTHSQFNLGNALSARYIIDFLRRLVVSRTTTLSSDFAIAQSLQALLPKSDDSTVEPMPNHKTQQKRTDCHGRGGGGGGGDGGGGSSEKPLF